MHKKHRTNYTIGQIIANNKKTIVNVSKRCYYHVVGNVSNEDKLGLCLSWKMAEQN